MPNWCSNNVTFTHASESEVARLVQAYNEDRLLSEFLPCPEELKEADLSNNKNAEALIAKYGAADWYSWRVNNWGTKWDVQSVDEVTADGNTVSVYFDSAWSPPLEFYRTMEEQGWKITAYYHEPGMAFCGKYEDGVEYHYDITGDSAWVRENIPSDLDEMFSIAESMETWEEDERSGS